MAIDSVTSYMHNNAAIMAKMNDIADTINRISSRYQQMQKYEAYKDKLEMSTLITFAEWTVSPNAHSVHHLMDRLHIILFGTEDRANSSSGSSNLLSQLAIAYEVIPSVACRGTELGNSQPNPQDPRQYESRLDPLWGLPV